MTTPFLPRHIYILFFFLIGVVYFIGLFVPLPDNDAAHHASIALRMYLTGDYASLVDQRGDYLDKPHLLFWLSALSYKIFGVTPFAYKFPTFLFTILGIYSTFNIGKTLYNREVGKLAALLISFAFAFILAVTDVRMDAILTACIALATWQLLAFIQNKQIKYVAGAALGLALGFSTKGHIAVFVPAVTAFFYILYQRDWKLFINWKWILLILLFGLFISPVVYAFYLQYNLHPEKIVRGKDHINGVLFILFNQSIERFSGGMGADAKHDYFFFLHSFLWAFAPWSMLTYLAVAGRLKNFKRRDKEWGTTASFMAVLIIVSLSSFKLPHYLNIVFPVAAVMTALLIIEKQNNKRWLKFTYPIQVAVAVILLLLAAVLSIWAFPLNNIGLLIILILLLSFFFYFVKSKSFSNAQKLVLLPMAAMLFTFFILNAHFFPQLLTYQAGQNMARISKDIVNPEDVYVQQESYSYSSSYTFATKSKYNFFNDTVLLSGKPVWLQTDPSNLETLRKEGYQLGRIIEAKHFRISMLTLKFLNPASREKELSTFLLVEILGKN